MPEAGTGGDGPIFLAGVDRSGLGLLGEVLECHPDVSMTRRTNFWSYYDGRFGDLSYPANLTSCLDETLRDSRMRVFAPDRERLRQDFHDGPPSYSRLFELLQTQLMGRRSATRWGDKSLGSERHAETILAAYPAARMVHMIRDPRDRYVSQKLHRGPVRGGAGHGAALWRWSARLAASNAARLTGRYYVVRYEDLVEDTDRSLEAVRTFLDLSEAPLSTDRQPLTGASVGRYQRDLSLPDRTFIEWATRHEMNQLGYTGDANTMAWAAQLRYRSLTFPGHMLSGLRWRVTTKVRDHRGRSPAAGRLVGAKKGNT